MELVAILAICLIVWLVWFGNKDDTFYDDIAKPMGYDEILNRFQLILRVYERQAPTSREAQHTESQIFDLLERMRHIGAENTAASMFKQWEEVKAKTQRINQ